ncbi:MAG: bifunctional DNA-formamidopyrimidine glycosylase/DNA-(apurinic or apyrimidinic site) lyase [Rhodospirillaceae bacterium]|nr:bifunctional DNA-formamidopyrimidine glycosylase/DNA-(apurinic or apyrimidinic site) lyase [Rhodospirillaceae bacterium]
MPELPEVETVRRGLEPAIMGAKITRVLLRRKNLRKPFPKAMKKRLEGLKVISVARRAKYLLVGLTGDVAGDVVLIWHLGMSGQVRIYKKGEKVPRPEKHDHVQIDLSGGVSLVYTDPRRFGLMDLSVLSEIENHPLLKDIGPEPLGRDFTGRVLKERLGARKTEIKLAIMDQKVVAGVGNIYASEALFKAGISPRRQAGKVSLEKANALVREIKVILKRAIKAGGSTLKDHRTTDGGLGYFQHSFAMYDKEGEPCPGCDCNVGRTGGIKRIVQGGRATFYCPRAQR